jgi:hypothetical protein
MAFLAAAAPKMGVTVNPILTERWTESRPDNRDLYMTRLVDAAVSRSYRRCRQT